MSLESKEFWIITFAGLLVIYGGFLVFSRWCIHSPAVPGEKLNQLHTGMSRAEVRRLLGDPPVEGSWRGQPEWRYGRRLKHHRLILRFDSEGRLNHFEHVHAYDPDHRELT
jgi:hypothetical protein